MTRRLASSGSALLFALVLLGACAGQQRPRPVPAPVPDIPYGQGLLWKIEAPGQSSPAFVFGTIHVDDPRVTNLPPVVEQAFTSSQSFHPEIAMDPANLARLSMRMFYRDGRTLEEALGPSLYESTEDLLEDYGIPEDAARFMQPWAVIMILSTPPQSAVLRGALLGEGEAEVLDVMLYRRALEREMLVVELETVDEQVAIFDGLSREDQVALIRAAVQDLDNRGNLDLDDLIRAYSERNLARIVQSLTDQERGNPLLARVHRRLLNNRNHVMTNRMDGYMRAGGAFVAVGALHLPGKEGVLQLLENRGFVLTRLY